MRVCVRVRVSREWEAERKRVAAMRRPSKPVDHPIKKKRKKRENVKWFAEITDCYLKKFKNKNKSYSSQSLRSQEEEEEEEDSLASSRNSLMHGSREK